MRPLPGGSLYPRGLATLRPIDGANVAILTMKPEQVSVGYSLLYPSFTPILYCFAILHFRHFGNIYTIFSLITRNKKAIYPANSKRVKWSKKINVQIPVWPSCF